MSGLSAVVVDHRDSFVFNLVDDLARLGVAPTVVGSGVSLEALDTVIARVEADLVVLSPGPGHPRDAGVMVPFLRRGTSIPVLGICLGAQAMALATGGEVASAPTIVHGRASRMRHHQDPLFDGLPPVFRAARYHSLAIADLGDELVEIAATEPDAEAGPIPMAVRHRVLPWVGLQFHPESVLTPQGPRLMQNLLRSLR